MQAQRLVPYPTRLPEMQRTLLDTASAGLAFLGRHAAAAVAVLVVLGIGLPPLGALLRPLVPAAVFALLCTAFVRLDPPTVVAHLRRPGLLLAAIAWTSLALPFLFGIGARLVALASGSSALHLGLVLQGATSPVMAAAALAGLMGLDATIVLLAVIGNAALLPLTAPLFVRSFAGSALSLLPWELAVRLFALLAGSALLALVLRRLLGADRIARRGTQIDGLNVLLLFVFVAGVMSGVAHSFAADPWFVLAIAGLAFTVFGLVFAATVLLFARAGRDQARTLGFMCAQRNVGLMIAATGGALPATVWLYFALAQLPIYLSPLLARLLRRAGPRRA